MDHNEREAVVGPELAKHPRSHSINAMARVISNMNVTNPIKKLVSQKRKRYIKDGFNLDLTYILDNLIAMGFPAEKKLEGVYRNNIDEVARFLDEKHNGHYKVYNLCAEKEYDTAKFHQRVANYPFDDHNPPCMEVIKPFCEDVASWLAKDHKNVAVVHCKAGKGRTGVMVSCYMLHSGQFQNAMEALNFYGQKRTTDRKGVTIPSQRRYVNYYASLVRDRMEYRPVKLFVREICFEPVPSIFATQQGSVMFVISECKRVGEFTLKVKKLHTSITYDVKKGQSSFRVPLLTDVAVQGDVKIEFFKCKLKKEKLFHFWFNTFFVREILSPDLQDHSNDQRKSYMSEQYSYDDSQVNNKPRAHSVGEVESNSKLVVLKIDKNEIDDAHKDKQNKIFSADFQVSLILENLPKDKQLGVEVEASESSEAESSTESSVAEDEEEAWESVGEPVEVLGVGDYQLLHEDPEADATEQALRL
ncbi:phosphatidylinositol 3,4,5-trisphosphate 3-phosphatase and dual-specificity protein phosphatase PTEN isoform X2 [Planococcus citri]|uniref:phosphatidylinositol 3,4,5-trisphosphate 3-phosphatase and dual-specificity protein phosphatase PTEN isoform X2 n=1 Tax=Planococcus citri TaxID=170843 RepID=UPI0031FA07A4